MTQKHKYMARPKGLNGTKKPKEEVMRGHNLKSKFFNLDTERLPGFIRDLDWILKEESKLVRNQYGMNIPIQIFTVTDEGRVYIGINIKRLVKDPELFAKQFYGRQFGIESYKVTQNFSRSQIAFKRTDVATIVISENGKNAAFYTLNVEKCVIPFNNIYELGEEYRI